MEPEEHNVDYQNLSYNKYYGWSKYLVESNSKTDFSWLQQQFSLYHEEISHALFNPTCGYYSTGIVKIGGKLSDYSSNGTSCYGEAFILLQAGFAKWLELNKPGKFWFMELSGGNGKLAHRILSMLFVLADQDADFKKFWQAVRYRIVDISPSLRETQLKQNEQFVKLDKFAVILSDVADNTWYQQLRTNDAKLIICNELIDTFVPEHLLVRKNEDSSCSYFENRLVNFLLVENAEIFVNMCQFDNQLPPEQTRESLTKLYKELLQQSDKLKQTLAKQYNINCNQYDLLLNHQNYQKVVVDMMITPRLNKLKAIRQAIYELEEDYNPDATSYDLLISKEEKVEHLCQKYVDAYQTDFNFIWGRAFHTHLYLPISKAEAVKRAGGHTIDLEFDYANHKRGFDSERYRSCFLESTLTKMLDLLAKFSEFDLYIFDHIKYNDGSEGYGFTRDRGYFNFTKIFTELFRYSKKQVEQPYSEVLDSKQLGENVLDTFSYTFYGIGIALELDPKKLSQMLLDQKAGQPLFIIPQKQLLHQTKLHKTPHWKSSLELINQSLQLNLQEDIQHFLDYGNEVCKVILVRKTC